MRPVHVRSARLHPLFNHADTTLRLPADGVVLITGANESGKTALIDAVAYALFGETVSGRSPWPGDRGAVTVETDAVTASRVRKSRTAVSWHRNGEEPVPWESPTKAAEALAAEVGSFRVWSQTAVLNRRNGEAFLARSDADRKRLLEEVLDLGVLDAAHKRATAALSAATREADAATAAARAARARAEASQRAAAAAGPAATPAAPSPADVLDARAALTRAAAELDAARAADADAAAEVRRIDGQLRSLVAAPTACPTCRRPFDGAAEAATHIEAERAMLTAARVEAHTLYRATQTTLATAARTHREADNAVRALDFAVHAAREAEKTARLRAQLATTAAEHTAEAEAAEAACAGPVHRAAVLAAAREVLGVTGVRGHLLGSALPVLQASANAWLARLGRPGWSFALASSSQNADGVVVDKLSVTLSGTPNGGGYAELSEGAKHRAHIAMALALGELASSLHPDAGGTWFFDEALDAPLDADGAAATAEALRDIARGTSGPKRCVVVIGHSPEIARVLRPDLHYTVDAGVVTLRRASDARL